MPPESCTEIVAFEVARQELRLLGRITILKWWYESNVDGNVGRLERVLPVMSNASSRRAQPERTHDGTIVNDQVNEMWGPDMSQTATLEEGRAYVFVAVEHANSEIIGIHAALEPVRQGVHQV